MTAKIKNISPRRSFSLVAVGAKPRLYLLDVPFAFRALAQAAGAKWHPGLKSWTYEGAGDKPLPESIRPFGSLAYTLERLHEDRLNGVVRDPSTPTRNIILHDHQADAIRDILRARRIGRVGFLLADEVGLGKTISAWKAVASMPDIQRVLIVAPLSVLANWRNTISWLGDHGKQVVIINYDRLSKLFSDSSGAPGPTTGKKAAALSVKKAPAKKATKKGLARSGSVMEFDAVIFDESHRLKNPDAIRTRFAMRLASKAKFRIWMSATAGAQPLDLSYMSPLLAQMTGAKVSDLKDFEAWCQDQNLGVSRGAFGKWVWSGADADLKRVHRLLFGGAIPAGLRRVPEHIAGWPEINRILLPIDLGPDEGELYLAAWTEFRESLRLTPASGRDNAGALVARLRFRQKSSLLRVAGTIQHVQSLLENGHQVAVNMAFLETLNAMASALEKDGVRIARIFGGQGAQEREAERLAFQRGERTVALSTVTEGVSLHQGEYNDVPRSHVIHDISYSPIQMAQTEGRCHRDGRFAQVYWAFGAETIEADIAEIVARRLREMKSMVGDDTAALKEIEDFLKERAST